MIETDGLAILYSWLIFAGLLCILAFVVLRSSANRRSADPTKKSAESATERSHRDHA
jgi:hypothetical protein